MVAQARSAWLASSLRLASYVALRPLLVMVLRIAINELVMSVALTSYSRQPRRMSGEGTVVIPQPAGDEPVIKNTFFFPDIDPKRVRERMRLEQTVAPARLREAIKSGMAETNAELYEYREQKIAAGFTRLADVPADDIDGESIKVFYYERAVCAMTTASLYERYRGVDASAKGDKKADSIDSTIDELWRDMRSRHRLASRNRLEASVAPSLAGIKIPHIDQSQESDAKFLTRLAERNGGEVSVKMGKLLFLKAGQGETASGKKIPQITITRSDGDRHHFAIADRGAYTGVTAKWLHTKDPKPQKQKVKLKRKKKEKHLRALEHPKAKPVRQKKAPKVPEAREGEYMAGEADNVFALTTVYATKAQAMRAAQAKWDKLQRGVAEFSIILATGRADIYTETPVKVSGFKRVIDEQDWTITKVTHFLNNSGFTTSLELEVRLSDVEYETEDYE